LIDIAFNKTLQSPTGQFWIELQTGIERGSLVTLFGASGAGKTTILRMLAGLTQPDSGRIIVSGETWFDSTKKVDLPPQRRAIGFVFQDYALFPNLSVRGNVGYAAGKGDGKWVDELLALVGLTAYADRMPPTLSSGQKQRVALARALARKPMLLLLDEPLSALDTELRDQLQDDLLRAHQHLELTTILVTHDIGEVFKLSQRVLCIDQGRITRSGTPNELFLQQRLSGKLNLAARVLAIRREEVIYILSLSIGQDIVEIVATDDEVVGLKVGDKVSVSAKAFSPVISR